MPKNTFFNLAEEKRNRILEISIDEFAVFGYQNASISRIVEKAEIAKGSFYQYFEDKKDLFKYVVDVGAEKKLNYFRHLMEGMQEMDFFQLMREIFIGGIQFAKENPKLSTIGDQFMKSTDEQLKKEVLGENIPKSNQFIEGLLIRGIAQGDIDPAIDVKMTAHMLTTFTMSIGEYFIKEVRVKDNMEIMALVDKMLEIVKYGIHRK
ncbi:transcriptional regulator, TetR family [Geosporobacter subterraneus DSM 17957]|uniref:Transcriptional regulator, TetR family n=1 Tax=Geosporobacter subterraneus DSM 17957 TaxID=1121919 RepID=A0A1M6NBP2_9FIRM|nr:TetR/AcrR family transcriptional regulator [Geosporobacter subterraneus]SHJ93135.1 transcriptional regulator, TetR family [Geosporobacter subterraneus DSM 17957]